MRTITANLDAKTRGYCIQLFGAMPLINAGLVRIGDHVRLTDEYVEVEAEVVAEGGFLVARPIWGTIRYVH